MITSYKYRILGLDASSTTVGWGCLDFDENWNLLQTQMGFLKPPKEDHIVEKLKKTRELINNLIDQLVPTHIALEEILFQHPKTTIKTLATLAVFNRSVCLWAYDKLDRMPYLLAPLKVRHAIKLNSGREVPKKEEIPALMEHYLGKLTWPSQIKGKHKGEKIKECADIADGLAVAYALKVILHKEQLQLTNKKSPRKIHNGKKRSFKNSKP